MKEIPQDIQKRVAGIGYTVPMVAERIDDDVYELDGETISGAELERRAVKLWGDPRLPKLVVIDLRDEPD